MCVQTGGPAVDVALPVVVVVSDAVALLAVSWSGLGLSLDCLLGWTQSTGPHAYTHIKGQSNAFDGTRGFSGYFLTSY